MHSRTTFQRLAIVSLMAGAVYVAGSSPVSAQRRRGISQQQKAAIQKLDEESFRLNQAGNWREAIPVAEAFLAARREVFDESSYEVAIAKTRLGYSLGLAGRGEEALAMHRQALSDLERVRGEEHVDTNNVRFTLASAYSQMGRFSDALQLNQQALRISQEQNGAKHPQTAGCHNAVGYCQLELGDFTAARIQYETAIAIYRQAEGDFAGLLGQVLNNLAAVSRYQGDLSAAITKYEEALAMSLKAHGENHVLTASIYNNIGSAYRTLNKLPKAREAFEKALEIREQNQGKEHIEYLTVQSNLAGVLFEEAAYAETLAIYEQVLKSQKRVAGIRHPHVGRTLSLIASIHVRQQDFDKARDLYMASIENCLMNLGSEHPETISTRWNLATNELYAAREASGLAQIDAARRAARRHVARVLPGLPEDEQLSFVATVDQPQLHKALANAFIRRDQPTWREASAAWLVNGKGVAQESLGVRARLLREGLEDPNNPDVDELLDVRSQVDTLRLSGGDPASRPDLENEEARLTRAILQKNQHLSRAQWHDLADIRVAITPGSVLIDFTTIESEDADTDVTLKRYVAWVIPAAGEGDVQIVNLGEAEPIDELLVRTREMISDASREEGTLRTQGESAANDELLKASLDLRERLWTPLVSQFPEGTSELIVCPESDLWLFPWAALPIADNRSLIEDYSLRLVTSARDVLTPEPVDRLATSAPLIFADPDFDLSTAGVRKALKSEIDGMELGPQRPRKVVAAASATNVQRLPNTLSEAKFIAPSMTQFAVASPRIFSDNLALETLVRSVRRPQMLVLSTHGFFSSTEQDGDDAAANAAPVNPLQQCGLLLAGCNSGVSMGDEDGVLTGTEILDMDLVGTQLVVLSACQTGLGRVHQGEGVAGLRQAFQLAGAESVVATLWQVPDRDSALLMTDFFANLAKGESKSVALRNAQLARIESRRERYGAAHPYFWAAWTITGR